MKIPQTLEKGRIMDLSARPCRSVLYIPGSNPRALEKARTLPVDAIIFDLEDAVAASEKRSARTTLFQTLIDEDYGARIRLVRVNGLDTDWGLDDVAACRGADIDGVLLPKVDGAADIQELADLIPDVAIWAMMETCKGILHAAEIAAHPRVAGLVLGTNDLAKELSSRNTSDRAPLLTSLQLCLLGARAGGVICVDGVFNAFRDMDGLQVECEQGRDLGFDGKTLIHPAQIAAANTAFAPSQSELDLARRQIEAFDAAQNAGQGVAVLDGSIVENLHIVTAKATLAKADAIAAMED